MIHFADIRIFLCLTPVKMSYSFDSLMGQAQKIFNQDPLSGHLFLFLSRDRDRIKILFWDRDGFCIWYKKPETEDAQIFGFTEVGRAAYNHHLGPAEAGRVVGIPRTSGPRRRIMPGQGSPSVPPRAPRQGKSSRSIGSGRS